MEIEVSAFGNFSTDTRSTDCKQVNINVFRFRRSRPSVPHGANFSLRDFSEHIKCMKWKLGKLVNCHAAVYISNRLKFKFKVLSPILKFEF